MGVRFVHTRAGEIAFLLSSIAACTLPGLAASVSPLEDLGDGQAIVQIIEFEGLRRVPAETLRALLCSRMGQPLNTQRVERDVRALDRLGWFDSVRAEIRTTSEAGPQALRLVFVLEERPFLSSVRFQGSRLLTRQHIESALQKRQIVLKTAAPASRAELWRAARALRAALSDAGHPQARIQLRLEHVPAAAVRAVYVIEDGPEVLAGSVRFAGNRTFSEDQLRREMKRIAPGARFAGLRDKNIYTLERLAGDLERLSAFYHNRGYPEAKLGSPKVVTGEVRVRRWWPWPQRRAALRYEIWLPIEEGHFFRFDDVRVGNELPGSKMIEAAELRTALRSVRPGKPFSEEALRQAGEALSRLHSLRRTQERDVPPDVALRLNLDHATGTAQVDLQLRPANPYVLRRIEFVGHRQFSDRYYRRRIRIREGEAFDPAKLESGLAQLSRSGFIRPVKKEDVQVRFVEAPHATDLTIRVEELGRQRISFVGGHAGLGSTVGLVYNVFDLLGFEELLTAHFEGGPESLQALLGVAKEGIFGTRVSLGLSAFRSVLRPNLPGFSGSQRLFTSRSSGLGLTAAYPLSPEDTLTASYELSSAATRYHVALPPGLAGLPVPRLDASSASRSFGLSESHQGNRSRLETSASVSGGWLGGSEDLVRSSVEYARVVSDPLTRRRNTWAFRGHFSSVASYRGDLPLDARLFPSDDLVRGFRTGELGPYSVVSSVDGAGNATARAEPTGADLVAAANAEYRASLLPRTEAVGFFDAGSGWLLLPWTGDDRPSLLEGTSGAWRASTGLELRFMLPGVEQPLRVHYAVNPLRLARVFPLPGGTTFHAPDRRGAWGWALGSLF